MRTLLETINFIAESNVQFICTHRDQCGEAQIVLKPHQLLIYLNDPADYIAKHYKVTKEQYIEWHKSNYSVFCCGKTKKGRKCKNVIPDGLGVDAKTWAALQGNYCHLHSR